MNREKVAAAAARFFSSFWRQRCAFMVTCRFQQGPTTARERIRTEQKEGASEDVRLELAGFAGHPVHAEREDAGARRRHGSVETLVHAATCSRT